MPKESRYERQLAQHIDLEGLPHPQREYRFASHLRNERGHVRMWRFDFAWPEQKVAAEVDGGRFMVRKNRQGVPVPIGQHMTESDYAKLNVAAIEGWRVLRFTPQHIRTGKAARWLKEVLMR
jgi:very-short-patch-repair endonuclease